jgi:hypothetical protein
MRRASHVLDTGGGCALTDERDDRLSLSIQQTNNGFLLLFQVFLKVFILFVLTHFFLLISTFFLFYLLPPDFGFCPNQYVAVKIF